MITKTQFLAALDALAKQDREDGFISAHLQMICPESNVMYVTKYAQPALLDLLEIATHDADKWVSYWLYDLDHGKKYKPGTVKVYGKNVKLKTPDDLYKMLLKSWKERQNGK